MKEITFTDRTVAALSFNDARENNDIPGMVSATSTMATTLPNKPFALSMSMVGLTSSITSLGDKISNNTGIKASDIMATQAALGTVIGLTAESLGESIGKRDKKTGELVSGLGNGVSKAATVYAASAYAMNKSKTDFAVWDPANKTGLPKVSEMNSADAEKIGDIVADNAKSEFDKSLNDLADTAQKFDDGFKENFDKLGESLLPKLLDLSDTLDKAFDPDTWKEKFDNFRDWLREKFDDISDWFDQLQKDFGDWFIPWAKDFGDWTGLNRDGKYHIYDPLVLDLDGDGIETVGTQGYAGALFDHDKDGIRTSTGWAAADDGLLVIDRNSDGLINNGGELFGDSTVLKDGSNAVHGYAALAEFDSNSDGKVDAQDADFAKLKVWRDLNQDGVSQDGELFTLAEVGVQSLNADYQDVNQRLGNGNTIAQKGSYTTADGETRDMGDLLLAADHLHSRYVDSVQLTEEQMQAANVQGIGRLRDLREAA